MKKPRLNRTVMVICVFYMLVATIDSQTTSQMSPQQQKKGRAVLAIRAINTAEMRFQSSKGRYGSFAELVASGQFANPQTSRTGGPVLNPDSVREEDAVPGYKMHLVVAGSGASYAVHLSDTEQCQTAFFSDERGVIFQGQALGCPSTSPSGPSASGQK